jgi:hypothetical protein
MQPQLEYGKPPPVPNRSVAYRAAIAIAIVIAGTLAWLWWPQVRASYYERQCRAYTTPADQVMYAEDAAQTAARYPQQPSRRYVPLSNRQPIASKAVIPPCWRDFLMVKGTSCNGNAILFLHERRSPAGNRALVAVEFNGWGALRAWQFCYHIYRTNGSTFGYCPIDLRHDIAPGSLKLFAGQPDQADSSHFTIGYAIGALPGVLDGWLQDDKSIRLQVRDGPAKF